MAVHLHFVSRPRGYVVLVFFVAVVVAFSLNGVTGWVVRVPAQLSVSSSSSSSSLGPTTTRTATSLFLSSKQRDTETPSAAAAEEEEKEELPYDYEVPEDAVVNIKPAAMRRLRELRDNRKEDEPLILRMGVRSGGCSGMSYVMDFTTANDVQEDDAVDEYPTENIKCVVDAKSMLYLYGLELDYSDKLIGGGFLFFNPNAEESCGCGSSFGV